MNRFITLQEAAKPYYSFVFAYIAAFLSSYYVVAKHPEVASPILTSITSILAHCTKNHMTPASTETLKLRPMADWVMIPNCLTLATSISSIVRNLQVDRFYASMLPVAVLGTFTFGWALNLTMDLVVFGVLPMFMVTGLLVVRLRQGRGKQNIAEQGYSTEKA